MATYRVRVRDQSISYSRLGTSVKDSVGTEFVQYALDNTWEDLQVFACFRNTTPIEDGVTVPEYHILRTDPSQLCAIPSEVYLREGELQVGVLGLRDAQVVKPTLWVSVSQVQAGVNPNGQFSTGATPSAVQQLSDYAAQAAKCAQELHDAAVAGQFDGGYYTPSVVNGFMVFTPSKADMPKVEPVYLGALDDDTGQLPLPPVVDSDEGKYLRVQNGVPVWGELIIPEQYGLVTYNQDRVMTIT